MSVVALQTKVVGQLQADTKCDMAAVLAVYTMMT
jgi:hypothetical protein